MRAPRGAEEGLGDLILSPETGETEAVAEEDLLAVCDWEAAAAAAGRLRICLTFLISFLRVASSPGAAGAGPAEEEEEVEPPGTAGSMAALPVEGEEGSLKQSPIFLKVIVQSLKVGLMC